MKIFAILFCFLSVGLYAQTQTDVRDSTTGTTFPSTVSFQHEGKTYNLQATGVATRKKLIINVYSVAHYLQEGAEPLSDKLEEIMSDKNAKQLTLKWLRNVDAKRVQDGYRESFQKAGIDYSHLESDINQYIQFFSQDVQKGDEHVLRWLPEGYVEVLINGSTAGSITDTAFARALWRIWFGQNSVVNRNNLISLMH